MNPPNSPPSASAGGSEGWGNGALQASHNPTENAGLIERQWLVTNGQGGYASATVDGKCTWKYHGLLVAALPGPLGRTVMLNQLTESFHLEGSGNGTLPSVSSGDRGGSNVTERGSVSHPTFHLENQLPVWSFAIGEVSLEKRILLPFLQNTVHITYRHRGPPGSPRVVLELRPAVHFRAFEADPGVPDFNNYAVVTRAGQFEFRGQDCFPPLRVRIAAPRFQLVTDGGSLSNIRYPRDADRGYSADGELWSPGYFSIPLEPGQSATLIASTETWTTILALSPEEAAQTEMERRERLGHICHPAARSGFAADLVLAADQFIVTPAGRVADSARALARGDELRSVIAGYHWFGDWGRDTMISLEGLALATGRWEEAGWILRTFARYVLGGLIPNLFPEGTSKGLYHTADATLWFFHAASRYVKTTGDRETLRFLLPILQDIVEHHQRGTLFGIGVDPADGLLRQGVEGYQLTWMDAKVGDWVVTPRRGKAVEINALWYNALKVLEGWCREQGCEVAADTLAAQAGRAKVAFQRRFWNAERNCLFDVVDSPDGKSDPAVRPNQILAISLDYPVLDPARWPAVLEIVQQQLLTPLGLRSLSPDHPDYKPRYWGDLRSRDAAYHQGTVWAWLIGPFVDAWLKAYPGQRAEARKFLAGFSAHLDEACVGSISEIFDAEPPYTPRGCISQAWSVAEVLRAHIVTAEPGQGIG